MLLNISPKLSSSAALFCDDTEDPFAPAATLVFFFALYTPPLDRSRALSTTLDSLEAIILEFVREFARVVRPGVRPYRCFNLDPGLLLGVRLTTESRRENEVRLDISNSASPFSRTFCRERNSDEDTILPHCATSSCSPRAFASWKTILFPTCLVESDPSDNIIPIVFKTRSRFRYVAIREPIAAIVFFMYSAQGWRIAFAPFPP
mmetsp:Transcript_47103/g.75670  ORF Transcript_47103/g.75670 Transcript_47103/m.75670 type:complete len:205 (+) Transcript_47103:868-1482(+)